MTPEDEKAFAKDHVAVIKELPSGDVIGLFEQLHSWSLNVYTGDYAAAVRNYWDGRKRRFCYGTLSDALAAGFAWNGEGDPPGRWIKDKSPGQDRLNPAFGTAEFDEV